MAQNTRNLDAYRRALDALMSDHGVDADDRDYIDRAAATLMRIIKRREGSLPSLASAGSLISIPDPQKIQRTYDGLSVAEAAAEYLKSLDERDSKTLVEIVKHLQDHGYEFETDKPEGALATALRRRAGNYRDVFQLGRGKWGLRIWYSQREITAVQHKERTRAGMDAAKARGVKMGKGWGISAEQAAELKRLLAEGSKQTQLARMFGVTPNTIHRYKKLLQNWNPGDSFPPSQKGKLADNAEDQNEPSLSGFRVIK